MSACFLFLSGHAFANPIPSAADATRISPFKVVPTQQWPSKQFNLPTHVPGISVPEAAEQLTFKLEGIDLQNMKAFKTSEIAEIYKPYMGQNVPLATLWHIAGQITQFYREQGYFLCRAYVPQQEIEDGIAVIKVVEGAIADIKLDSEQLAHNPVVQELFERIQQKQPVTAYELEKFMLLMNSFPGVNFRAVLEPIENAPAGLVSLSLLSEEIAGRGTFTGNNYGSKFLGPYQASVTYEKSYVPLQNTAISVLTSTPVDELNYVGVEHSMPISPDLELNLSASHVQSQPGDSLEENDIQSTSTEFGLGVTWQAIRQRQENLAFTFEFNTKNSNGDILDNNPLTRDRIRVLRAGLNYDNIDRLNGFNFLNLKISQGLDVMGASQEGDANLSRAEVKPNFTTAQFSYLRQQGFGQNFMTVSQLSGQLASGPLFSSEEFGYGGQNFGRAYDPSDITGDHGLAASLELRYVGLKPWQKFSFQPYTFYDVGKVWNEDNDGVDVSAASAGVGVRLSHHSGMGGNIGLAWPLTKAISSPLYGNGKSPRVNLQLNYGF